MGKKLKKKTIHRRKALIVDIDGTLTDPAHRLHLFEVPNPDWDAVNAASVHDKVNKWCKTIVDMFHRSHFKIIFLTARNEGARVLTEHYLTKHLPDVEWKLFMRPTGDNREDFLIKKEIYLKEIRPKYKVLFCLDDNEKVVKMWRELGLVCLFVEPKIIYQLGPGTTPN